MRYTALSYAGTLDDTISLIPSTIFLCFHGVLHRPSSALARILSRIRGFRTDTQDGCRASAKMRTLVCLSLQWYKCVLQTSVVLSQWCTELFLSFCSRTDICRFHGNRDFEFVLLVQSREDICFANSLCLYTDLLMYLLVINGCLLLFCSGRDVCVLSQLYTDVFACL